MKKFYRVILLLIALFFLSTYTPNDFNSILEKDNKFFKIKNIIIVNNFLVEKKKIIQKLDKIYNKNIFLIKKKDIEKPLKEIDFLERIEVKKKYPDKIIVKIFETKPIAILYKNQAKYLLDSSSNLILLNKNINLGKFPSVFGKEAENNFIFFYKQLQNNKFPIKKIKNYYFFQIGRWDILLLSNKTIKFPQNNTEKAIKKSIELLDREDFENYKIIDLRVEGTIIVE